MAKWKRTKPNKPKPETCEALKCKRKASVVLGGFWLCKECGNRDYEKHNARMSPSEAIEPNELEKEFYD